MTEQIRSRLFKQNHEWDTLEFMIWINKHARKFEKETGLKTNNNQDKFTEYLKKNSEE